ncbi:acyloxyacyl hydrolase [Pseudomonas matsuisoli]|nr:acyloxyacyl hydrolase [Pseudomonas matsuisoli]
MNKLFTVTAAAVIALSQAYVANAADFSVSVGRTGQSSTTARLGLQFDFNRSWWQTDTGRLTGYWDAGYTFWKGDDRSDNHSLSLAPVFVYEFNGDSVKPYIEAGIGIAGFSRTHVEDRDLGSAFQFEDRIGAGLRFAGGHSLGIRAIHYSNAGIKGPNDGVETYSLNYSMAF